MSHFNCLKLIKFRGNGKQKVIYGVLSMDLTLFYFQQIVERNIGKCDGGDVEYEFKYIPFLSEKMLNLA